MLKGHDKVFLPEEQFRELTIRLRTEFDEVPWACKRCGKHPWWMYWW